MVWWKCSFHLILQKNIVDYALFRQHTGEEQPVYLVALDALEQCTELVAVVLGVTNVPVFHPPLFA